MRRNLFLVILSVVGVTVLIGILLPNFLTSELDVPEISFATPVSSPTGTQTPVATTQTLPNTGAQPMTPQSTPGRNCTHNIYYWKDHPEEWIAQVVFGGVAYDPNAAKKLIGGTQIPIPAPDTLTRLKQQLYVAFLNVSNGADGAVVNKILADANQWLLDNPAGKQMSEFNQQAGGALAGDLERFNNGEIGPGPCQGQPPTPATSPQVTSTLTPTSTFLPRRAAPTATPTPGGRPGPRRTPVPPTDTPPPQSPQPTATSQPPSPPTSTPQPPPLPTSTPQPPQPTDTNQPTSPPPPTFQPTKPKNTRRPP